MEKVTENTIELIRTLGTLVNGINRMVLSIEIAFDRETSAAQRLDEIKLLSVRCDDLEKQVTAALKTAAQLAESGGKLEVSFMALVTDFMSKALIIKRLRLLDRDWKDDEANRDIEILKTLGLHLSFLFISIRKELKQAENPKDPLSAMRSNERTGSRRPAWGRWKIER